MISKGNLYLGNHFSSLRDFALAKSWQSKPIVILRKRSDRRIQKIFGYFALRLNMTMIKGKEWIASLHFVRLAMTNKFNFNTKEHKC